MELYIHIPFCIRKCAYCDFLSRPADEKTQDLYMIETQRGALLLVLAAHTALVAIPALLIRHKARKR